MTRYDFGEVHTMSCGDAPIDATPTDTTSTQKLTETVRAVVAGGGATRLIASSVALFEAGGKHLLDEGARRLIRQAAERGTSGVLSAKTLGPIVIPVKEIAERPLGVLAASGTVRGVTVQAARVAGREVLKGAARAAGIGLAIDGAVASVEAVVAVRAGTMNRRAAAKHVAKEAATGAIATGAGVLLGAGLVALTGGAAAPVVFAVGSLGSIGTKRLLSRLLEGRAR